MKEVLITFEKNLFHNLKLKVCHLQRIGLLPLREWESREMQRSSTVKNWPLCYHSWVLRMTVLDVINLQGVEEATSVPGGWWRLSRGLQRSMAAPSSMIWWLVLTGTRRLEAGLSGWTLENHLHVRSWSSVRELTWDCLWWQTNIFHL